jgi:hypothetical protein
MDELPIRYLFGGACGLVAFALTTPLLGVPSSFALFVTRTLAIILVASVLGFWVFDRYGPTGSG